MAGQREASELGGMVKRMFRALARRAAEGDLLALEELVGLSEPLSLAISEAAKGAKLADYSYTEIGEAMGVSRQAARQRVERLAD